jgi:hypothetical protein
MAKVFKFDLGIDDCSRLLKPCQKGLTGAVEIRHTVGYVVVGVAGRLAIWPWII